MARMAARIGAGNAAHAPVIPAEAGMTGITPSPACGGGSGWGELVEQKSPHPSPPPLLYFVCHKIKKREREKKDASFHLSRGET